MIHTTRLLYYLVSQIENLSRRMTQIVEGTQSFRCFRCEAEDSDDTCCEQERIYGAKVVRFNIRNKLQKDCQVDVIYYYVLSCYALL